MFEISPKVSCYMYTLPSSLSFTWTSQLQCFVPRRHGYKELIFFSTDILFYQVPLWKISSITLAPHTISNILYIVLPKFDPFLRCSLFEENITFTLHNMSQTDKAFIIIKAFSISQPNLAIYIFIMLHFKSYNCIIW